MGAAFTIRPATPNDLHALIALEQLCFQTDHMSARQFRTHLRSASTAVILLAEHHQQLLGSACLFFRPKLMQARLYSLATAPSARGRGVAKALIQAAILSARARGAVSLRLEVRANNVAALALYAKLGFVKISALAGYYDDGTDGSRWRLVL